MTATSCFAFLSALPCAQSIDPSSAAARAGAFISGPGLTKKLIDGEETMRTIAGMLLKAHLSDQRQPCRYSITLDPSVKRESYLDYDLTIEHGSQLANDALHKALRGDCTRLAEGFCGRYITKLIEMTIRSLSDEQRAASLRGLGGPTSDSERDAVGEFIAHATGITVNVLFTFRSAVTETFDETTRMYRYKTGFHCYTSGLRVSPHVAVAAYLAAAAEYPVDAAFSRTVALTGSLSIAPTETLRRGFDAQPLLASILIPGCMKIGGKAIYSLERVIRYRIVAAARRVEAVRMATDDYADDSLVPYLPIFNLEPEALIEIPDITDLPPLNLPMPPELTPAEQEVVMEAEAHEVDAAVYRVIALLKLIPPTAIIGDGDGHLGRLTITNAVVWSLVTDGQLTESRTQWAIQILENLFRHAGATSSDEWGKWDHIAERVANAFHDGDRVHGINYIAKVATRYDSAGVKRVLAEFSSDSLFKMTKESFYRFKRAADAGRIDLISHMEGGALMHRAFGHNYTPRGHGAKTSWYRYDAKGVTGSGCYKWSQEQDIIIPMIRDVKDTLQASLRSIIDTRRETDVEVFAEKLASVAKRPTVPKDFSAYLEAVSGKCGDVRYIENCLKVFRSEYVGETSDFDRELDCVGVHNGILSFDPKTGAASLLTGDNRHLLVSRSLDAVYYADPSELAPHIARVWEIFRTIIPDSNELRYILLSHGCPLLTGRCAGKKAFIWYGTGGDGKTTLNSAFESLGGVGSNCVKGYSAVTDSSVLQYDKEGTSGHDGNVVHVANGPRWWSIPEAGSSHPFIDGGALKKKIDAGNVSMRQMFQSAEQMWIGANVVVLTNLPLEIRNMSVGEMRRIIVILFKRKFYAERDAALFRGLPNRIAGDPTVNQAFVTGPSADKLRAALLQILIGLLPEWYGRYDGNIEKIPIPPAFEKITSQFTGSTASIINDFVVNYLERVDMSAEAPAATSEESTTVSEDGSSSPIVPPTSPTTPAASRVYYMPLEAFIDKFRTWEQMTQRGSIYSYSDQRRGGNRQQPTAQASVSDPWVLKVLNMISGAPFAEHIYRKDGDMFTPPDRVTYTHVGPSELPLFPVTALFIANYRFRERSAPGGIGGAARTPAPASTAPPTAPAPGPASESRP